MTLKTVLHGYTDTTYSKEAIRWYYSFNKWYCGDLVVEEKVTTENITVDNKFTSRERVDSYVFMDFKTEKAAEYLSFSDTARVVRTFGLYDSLTLTAGNQHQALLDTSKLSRHVDMLPDTTVNNILYKRFVRSYTVNRPNMPTRYVQIYYLRPDMPESIGRIFFWSDSATRALKAPIVWAEERPSVNSPIILTETRIHFVADTLTTQEQKIFGTWKRNMSD